MTENNQVENPNVAEEPAVSAGVLDLDTVESALLVYLQAATGVDLTSPELVDVDFRQASINQEAHERAQSAANVLLRTGEEKVAFALRLIGAGPRVVPSQKEACIFPPEAFRYKD